MQWNYHGTEPKIWNSDNTCPKKPNIQEVLRQYHNRVMKSNNTTLTLKFM